MILARLFRDVARDLFHLLTRAKSSRNVIRYLPARSEPALEKAPSFLLPVFWGTSNQEEVSKIIETTTGMLAPGIHFADNFLTWARNMSMLDDAPFVNSWQSNAESSSDQAIIWRRYVLACAAYHCVQLDGDFVECGAYTGVGVKTIVDYLGGTSFPKNFWAYDIFEHDTSMLNHAMPEHGPELYERVCKKFENYPQVKILRGLIPDVFKSGCPERISYLHIDLNQAEAEIASLE